MSNVPIRPFIRPSAKPPDVQLICITFADDHIGIMAFVVTEYQPESNRPRWSRTPTDEAIQAEIDRTAFIPERLPIKGWRRITREEIPKDRLFRNAWRDRIPTEDDVKAMGAGDRKRAAAAPKRCRIVVDMADAREIHRNHIREARAYAFAQLDIESTKAREELAVLGNGAGKRLAAPARAERLKAAGARLARVVEVKQQLRDAPQDPAIEAARTPEDLARLWHPDLRKIAADIDHLRE